MKKQTYCVELQKKYCVGSYTNLFCSEYNKKYVSSFAISQPYKEDKETKLRDVSVTEILIFYDPEITSEEVIKEQVNHIKKEIMFNMNKIIEDMTVKLINDGDSAL